MWNLKYGTNEPISKKETDSQTQKTDLWLPWGWGEGEGKTEFWVSRCKTITFRIDKQQGPTVWQRNCIQSPGINYKGKEY